MSVVNAVNMAIETLPAALQNVPEAAISLALAKKIDDDETSAAGAAAASKELLSILNRLGLVNTSTMRTVVPNSPLKNPDAGDELDKLRKRRNNYEGSA